MKSIYGGALMVMAVSAVASAGLVDDFSLDLSKWNVYQKNASVYIGGNPISTSGPQNNVACLIPSYDANKYANLDLKDPFTLGAAGHATISFDMGFISQAQNNWGHVLQLVDSSNTAVLRVGHVGNSSHSSEFFVKSGSDPSVYSPSSVTQATNTWYHYSLTFTGTSVTVSIYSWTSSDPDAYASLTPVWTTTATVAAGDYTLMFVNNNSYLSPDPNQSYRDFMYVDNVYVAAVPEPAAFSLLTLGGLILLARRK